MGAWWWAMRVYEHGHGDMGTWLHGCMGLGSSGILIHVHNCNRAGWYVVQATVDIVFSVTNSICLPQYQL